MTGGIPRMRHDALLAGATPKRWPRQASRLGAQYGIVDTLGRWLHDGASLAAFRARRDAKVWLDGEERAHFSALHFRFVDRVGMTTRGIVLHRSGSAQTQGQG